MKLERVAAGTTWLAALVACCGAQSARAQSDSSDALPAAAGGPWIDPWLHTEFPAWTRGLRVRGLVAFDAVARDERLLRDSGLELDRATLRVEGRTAGGRTWRVAPDFAGVKTRANLEEAWIAFPLGSSARVALGLLRFPLGLESALLEEDRPLVDSAFPAHLDERHDWGLRLDAEHASGRFTWAFGAAGGRGFGPSGTRRDEPQLSLRLASHPFVRSADATPPWTRGAFVGAAYAWSPSYESELDVDAPFGTKLFDTDELHADEASSLHWFAGWDAGPVRAWTESTSGSLLGLQHAGGEADLENQITSWQSTLSWRVTGEPYDSRPYRLGQVAGTPTLPAHPLFGPAPNGHGPGLVELALRYSNADIDRELFALGLTDPQRSSQEFRSFSAAINWWPTRHLRVTVQAVRLIVDDDLTVLGNQGRATSVGLRVQGSL